MCEWNSLMISNVRDCVRVPACWGTPNTFKTFFKEKFSFSRNSGRAFSSKVVFFGCSHSSFFSLHPVCCFGMYSLFISHCQSSWPVRVAQESENWCVSWLYECTEKSVNGGQDSSFCKYLKRSPLPRCHWEAVEIHCMEDRKHQIDIAQWFIWLLLSWFSPNNP